MKIDDLSPSSKKYHQQHKTKKNLFFPFVAAIDKESLDENKLLEYLENTFKLRFKEPKTALPVVYGVERYGFKKYSPEQLEKNFPPSSEQVAPNCVVENFKPGLRARLGDNSLYNFVVDQLRKQSIEKDTYCLPASPSAGRYSDLISKHGSKAYITPPSSPQKVSLESNISRFAAMST